MSHAALQWALKLRGLRPTARHLLIELADRVNQERGDNVVWPSIATLVECTGLNRKTVILALANLSELGLIADVGRAGSTRQVVVYQVLVGAEITAAKSPEKGTVPKTEQFRFCAETVPFFPGNSTENGTRNQEENLEENQEGAHPGASEAEHLPEPPTWPADTEPTEQLQEAVIVTLPVNHNPDAREQPQPPDQPSKPKARSQGPVTLRTHLRDCAAAGVAPIPSTDAVFVWGRDVGLPPEFLALCWQEFRSRHIESDKKYRDWRQAFRNCARANWYRLWWVEGDGSYTLTTVGHMVKRRVEAEQARQQGMA